MSQLELPSSVDVVVVGSGAAALSSALTSALGGASVLVLEKSDKLGGTSAMSGAGVWIPANHLAAEAGIDDSVEEAVEYLHATAPDGWAEDEAPLWRSFCENAPKTLRMLTDHTPLEFALTHEPDPMAATRFSGKCLETEFSSIMIGGKGVGVAAAPRLWGPVGPLKVPSWAFEGGLLPYCLIELLDGSQAGS